MATLEQKLEACRRELEQQANYILFLEKKELELSFMKTKLKRVKRLLTKYKGNLTRTEDSGNRVKLVRRILEEIVK